MKVKEVCEKLGLNVHVQGDLDKEVHQGVVGDLLSFIMRTAPEEQCGLLFKTMLTWLLSLF